jgi:ribosome maturation factor RimP
MSAIPASVLEAVTAVTTPHGLDIEDVQLMRQGRQHVLDIMVDRDGGVDLDLTATVSHELSAALDRDDIAQHLPDGYVLQVGSPGVDRPLTIERHWRRAATRLVEAHLRTGDVFTDRVVAVADGTITFATHDPVSMDELDHGLVQVEFSGREQ